jgi:DnaJ family protein A protein 2
MEKEITLVEALTGVEFVINHLDGRKIRVKNTPGEVIKPDSSMTVESQGMPFHKKTYQNGSLIITFKVKFPAALEAKAMGLLTEALQVGAKDTKKG